tara:strand:+ start:7615 stop:8022 length:408 start_codon:yes stop_codon:yes gene_type:complete
VIARYRKGYKYQLAENLVFQTDFRPLHAIITQRVELNCYGVLTVREGYASDGVSGPVKDRKTNLRGGFIHDALYQLMRMGELSHFGWRDADKEFAKALKQDGAWSWVVWLDLAGLKIAGGKAAHPNKRKRVYSAP